MVKGELIFRYDNAKHKPALRFLEHKNTKEYAHRGLCKGLEKKPIKQWTSLKLPLRCDPVVFRDQADGVEIRKINICVVLRLILIFWI